MVVHISDKRLRRLKHLFRNQGIFAGSLHDSAARAYGAFVEGPQSTQ